MGYCSMLKCSKKKAAAPPAPPPPAPEPPAPPAAAPPGPLPHEGSGGPGMGHGYHLLHHLDQLSESRRLSSIELNQYRTCRVNFWDDDCGNTYYGTEHNSELYYPPPSRHAGQAIAPRYTSHHHHHVHPPSHQYGPSRQALYGPPPQAHYGQPQGAHYGPPPSYDYYRYEPSHGRPNRGYNPAFDYFSDEYANGCSVM